MEDEKLYKILRFYASGRCAAIQREHLTFEEAKEHCNRPDTEGIGWFDGMVEE